MHNEVVSFLNSKVSGCEANAHIAEVGDSSVSVNSAHIKDVCLALRDSDDYKFNVLQLISGVDFPEESKIEVNYILASMGEGKNFELILKTKVDRKSSEDLPELSSVSDVWASANFQERECYDMLGVNFTGHPDLRRILCPDDWEGYPLRKDYVVVEKYRGMIVNPQDKVNNEERQFIVKQEEENKAAKENEKSSKEEN
ncbi:MAG: NADH-quinone oxidoreductase subunit C [Halobacteriovoraceae bacterium]|nr:NADH-quinone oxidoreductase subunit C [Halobacteriovoraceae bacterium]